MRPPLPYHAGSWVSTVSILIPFPRCSSSSIGVCLHYLCSLSALIECSIGLTMIVDMTMTFLNLIFDTVVFVLTLAKTYHHVKDMQEFKQMSIAEVLLRDGK